MSNISVLQSQVTIQSAYGKSRELQSSPVPAQQNDVAQATDFSEMVQRAATEAVETVRRGDATATAGLTGQASIQQVVEATMAMESTVRTSVAVRDKIIEAYQDIMRMPI